MKLYKKLALTVATLALGTASSSAALLLTFTEEGGNVVMRTSGTGVDLTGAWTSDFDGDGGISPSNLGNQSGVRKHDNLPSTYEVFGNYGDGYDTLTKDFMNYSYYGTASGDQFYVHSDTFIIYDDSIADGIAPSSTVFNPATTITWHSKTLTDMFGESVHDRNTEISLWQNTNVAGADGNVSFSLGAVAAVPEPSSTALLGLGSLALLLRRRR